MEVYKLAYNDKSTTKNTVIVTISTITDHTDMTNFVEGPVSHKHTLVNDFYFPYKINMGQVKKITSLDEKQSFDTCYIDTTNHGRLNFQVGKFFKVANHDYEKEVPYLDNYFITVFKYKVAVLNIAGYVDASMSGVRYIYYSNGKIEQRQYYKHGKMVQKYSYYNNEYNSMEKMFKYSDYGVLETEYNYDSRENLISQTSYKADGTVHNIIRYDESQSPAPTLIAAGHKRPLLR